MKAGGIDQGENKMRPREWQFVVLPNRYVMNEYTYVTDAAPKTDLE